MIRCAIPRFWALLLLWPAVSLANPFTVELEKRSLQYFLDQANPESGLIRDRAMNFTDTPLVRPYDMASLAATGFGLAVLGYAAERGQITRGDAMARTGKALRFAAANLERHKGWLYHFVDWETGKRWGTTEISTIDTGFFVIGALSAAYRLKSPELIGIAEKFLSDLDFGEMLAPNGTLAMGWLPETGMLHYLWDSYAEQMSLVLLGMGHPDRPLPSEAWKAWKRPKSNAIIGGDLPLFVHQYSHLFVDFSRIATHEENFFENSVKATEFHRNLARDLSEKFLTFRTGFWGLSAGDCQFGYFPFSPVYMDGTVCPGCTGASAMFAPTRVLPDLEKWSTVTSLWGRYGFADGINLDRNWVSTDAIGITVGALYLSLVNIDSAPTEIPAVERALKKVAGIGPTRVSSLYPN